VFTDQKGRPTGDQVFTYRPTCGSAIDRAARRQRDAYLHEGLGLRRRRHKVILIGPQFGGPHWPKAAAYNEGRREGQPGREGWVFAAIRRLRRVPTGRNFVFGAGARWCSAWRSCGPTIA
jgi:hypothetical protein